MNWTQLWVQRPSPVADAENHDVWGPADREVVPHPDSGEFERYIPVSGLAYDELIEALARFEFERLESESDLKVVGGPFSVPWERCEPGLREEMMTWARNALEAVSERLGQPA